MARADHQVKIARINALQAIGVALIAGLAGVVTTLASQGVLRPGRASEKPTAPQASVTPSTSEANQPSAVGKPPSIVYDYYTTRLGLQPCKQRASELLRTFGALDVDDSPSNTVYAATGAYRLMIGCLTADGVVVLGASGPDVNKADNIATELVGRWGKG